jgi:hypothetical protein
MKKGRSPGLRLVAYLLIPSFRNNGFVDNNKLNSLQLREQLWFLTKFPFNAILKSKITTLIRGQM